MRHEDEEHWSADPADAVERATVLMGPALILTSIVLACGLAVTVFSDLPSLRTFGWLSAFAMLAALTADFLILRPTISFLRIKIGRGAGPQVDRVQAPARRGIRRAPLMAPSPAPPDQPRLSSIWTDLMSVPVGRIDTDCALPRVVTSSAAEKPVPCTSVDDLVAV